MKDPELKNALMRVHLGLGYMDTPCPYCGYQWQSVDDLIESDVVYAGEGRVAHPTCFYIHGADDEWRQAHPEHAPTWA